MATLKVLTRLGEPVPSWQVALSAWVPSAGTAPAGTVAGTGDLVIPFEHEYRRAVVPS
jgi:hypothetical protein